MIAVQAPLDFQPQSKTGQETPETKSTVSRVQAMDKAQESTVVAALASSRSYFLIYFYSLPPYNSNY